MPSARRNPCRGMRAIALCGWLAVTFAAGPLAAQSGAGSGGSSGGGGADEDAPAETRSRAIPVETDTQKLKRYCAKAKNKSDKRCGTSKPAS